MVSGNISPLPQSGRRFRTTTGEFADQGNGRWGESGRNGQQNVFTVVRQQPHSIGLFDAQRSLYVRLLTNRAEARPSLASPWRPWPGSEGAWVR